MSAAEQSLLPPTYYCLQLHVRVAPIPVLRSSYGQGTVQYSVLPMQDAQDVANARLETSVVLKDKD